jgi:hypothetical protein
MKADPAMNSNFQGMQIDFNEQFQKRDSSIPVKRDSLSNIIDPNVQRAKGDFGRISPFRGMQFDFNEQSSKHDSSISVSRDSFSNVIDSRTM